MIEDSGEENASGGTRTVFISYASQDAAVANAIVQALEKGGLRCWIAPRDVTPGSHYADHIMSAISGAKALVLVLSASALASKHVSKEVERAASKGRSIIALRTDAAPLTPAFEYFLSESQWIDVGAGGVAAVAAKLVEAVRSHVDLAVATGPVTAPVTAGRSVAPPLRRWVISAVAVVFTALFGYFVVDKFWVSKHAVGEHAVAALTPVTAPVAPTISEKSIAVLPFVDMSEHYDQGYFCDGLTEELISRLAQAPELKVIARTSSFQFKGKSDDVRIIAGKLAVANLIEGSIRRSGAHVRVTVQLVRAADGAHIWSQSYDREVRDTLKIQDDIADSVAKMLAVSLHLDARNTPSMSEAYVLFLRAREIDERLGNNESNYHAAIKRLEEVVKLDPKLGVAWADLSRMQQAFYLDYPEAGDRNAARATSLRAAERALQLAPQLAESHMALARILMYFDWEWARAEAEMQRALALSPSNAVVQRNAFYLSTFLGRWDEALQHATKATELDPLSADNFQRLGQAQANVYAFAQAESAYRTFLKLAPNSDGAHSALAGILWYQGRKSEAVAENDREADEASRLQGQSYIQLKLGHPQESTQALNAFVGKYGRSRPFVVGILYADLGRLDEAFRWWDRAISERDVSAAYLLSATRDTDLSGIGSDPRFKALVKKMKLPE